MSTSDPAGTPDIGIPLAMRQLTDPRALRALAHPVRIALLEAVGLNGQLTATEAAQIVGGTVANVSYHLRSLARHGYVVAIEGRNGRERPWRIVGGGMSIDTNDPDPTVGGAAHALNQVLLDRWVGRLRQYESHRDQYSQQVRAASGNSQFVVFGTAAEIEQAQAEIAGILARFTDRMVDPRLRPDDALPFEFLVSAHPFEISVPVAQED